MKLVVMKILLSGTILVFPTFLFAVCPSDKPIPTLSGCKSCDTPHALLQTKCITCDNEPDVDVLVVCPNRQRKGITTILKECPPDKPERTSEGDCYACSDEEDFYVSRNYVNPCPNRMIYHQGASYISGVICPLEKPVYSFGRCYSCDEEKNFYVPMNYKNICKNRKIYQKDEDTYLSVIMCPTDRPLRSKGKCYSCDEKKSLKFDDDISPNICPNRIVKNGYSSLKHTAVNTVHDFDLRDIFKTKRNVFGQILLIAGVLIYSIYYLIKKK
jgi:hypothetical protein